MQIDCADLYYCGGAGLALFVALEEAAAKNGAVFRISGLASRFRELYQAVDRKKLASPAAVPPRGHGGWVADVGYVAVGREIDRLPVDQLSEDGRKMMETVSAAAGEMQSLVDRLEDSPLLNEKSVGGIIWNFQSTAENFRLLSENLRDTPSLILWGKPPKRTVVEPRSRQ